MCYLTLKQSFISLYFTIKTHLFNRFLFRNNRCKNISQLSSLFAQMNCIRIDGGGTALSQAELIPFRKSGIYRVVAFVSADALHMSRLYF